MSSGEPRFSTAGTPERRLVAWLRRRRNAYAAEIGVAWRQLPLVTQVAVDTLALVELEIRKLPYAGKPADPRELVRLVVALRDVARLLGLDDGKPASVDGDQFIDAMRAARESLYGKGSA